MKTLTAVAALLLAACGASAQTVHYTDAKGNVSVFNCNDANLTDDQKDTCVVAKVVHEERVKILQEFLAGIRNPDPAVDTWRK